jgi:nucleoside-diphosphate-sugar epimerase
MEKTKNVLITSGSGKIGRNLLPELLKAGYHVRAIKFEEDIRCKDMEIIEGDLRDSELAKGFTRHGCCHSSCKRRQDFMLLLSQTMWNAPRRL